LPPQASRENKASVVSHKGLELFEQENTEATETKTLFSLFPHVKNNTTYLRGTTLSLHRSLNPLKISILSAQ
jgi:hypothetical protein